MFYLSYLKAELTRRLGKTITIALGLAIASAIIISIISVSSSLQASQEEVLNPLANVGTDMLVTRTVSTDNLMTVDEATRQEMIADNRVMTDLSTLGAAGDPFSNDTFAAGGNLTFDMSEATRMDPSLVADYATGLIMSVTHQEGTIPTITATFRTGGQRIQMSQNVQFSAEDMAALDAWRQANGGGGGFHVEAGTSGTAPPLPSRTVTSEFVVPEEDITQNVDIPPTDIQTTSYTIAGVDTGKTDIGLILPSQIVEGSYFSAPAPVVEETVAITETAEDATVTETTDTTIADTDTSDTSTDTSTDTAVATVVPVSGPEATEVIVSRSYAQKQSITVGSTLTINGHTLNVIGIVEPKLYTNTADIYISLPLLQELSGKADRVNVILVKSTDAANVDASTTALAALFTGATVTSAADTAKQVTGSLTSVTNLMNKFIGLVSFIVLIAAFVIVSLLTILSVNKRVREIGTLKAFGWSNFKIVRQILMENLVLGIIGAAAGIGFSILAIYGLNHANITLNADVASLNSSLGNMIGGFMGRRGGFGGAETTAATSDVSTTVVLNVKYAIDTLMLGSLVAIVGSLFAGLLASLKASRMRPQEALRNLE